jgi:hypothetical protein
MVRRSRDNSRWRSPSTGQMDNKTCRSCQRPIDANAKVCPYCDAEPESGQRSDSREAVETLFPPKRETSFTERIVNTLRARQGIIVIAIVLGAFVLLFAAHQFITARNEGLTAQIPAVPLTEVTDLSRQTPEEVPLPELEYFIEGSARTMRTYLVEPGAVRPHPEEDPLAEILNRTTPAQPTAAPRPQPQQQPAIQMSPSVRQPAATPQQTPAQSPPPAARPATPTPPATQTQPQPPAQQRPQPPAATQPQPPPARNPAEAVPPTTTTPQAQRPPAQQQQPPPADDPPPPPPPDPRG